MAIAFRADSDDETVNSFTTIAKPAGTTNGDALLAIIVWDQNKTITPPAGWTLIVQTNDGTSNSTTRKVAAYWKVAASEGASWTWTLSASCNIIGWVGAYSGAHATMPVEGYAVTAGVSGSTPDAPSYTTTHDNDRLICAVGGLPNSSLSSWTPPTGMTEREDNSGPGATLPFDLTLTVADVAVATAGATGAKEFTPNSSLTRGAAISIALALPQAPTVTAVAPAFGPITGGTTITVTGTHLTGASVTVGGSAATSVNVVSDTSLTCVTPAHAVGTVDVVVTTADGSATASSAFTYVDVTDSVVKLVKGGSVVGNNKAAAGQWPTTAAYASYGGAADLWGTTLTPAQVNASDFGVVLSALTGGGTAQVNHIQVTVYFTLSAAGTNQIYLSALQVDDDRLTVTPYIYHLPRAGLHVANDPTVERQISGADLYTSRLFGPSRTLQKAFREVRFWLEIDPDDGNTPGFEIWAAIEDGDFFQLLDENGDVATFRERGFQRAYFPATTAAVGYYCQLDLKVPDLEGAEVACAIAVRDLSLHGALLPIATARITATFVLGGGEFEDRTSMRRTVEQQKRDLRTLAGPDAAPVAYQSPTGETGYLRVQHVRFKEVVNKGSEAPTYVAEVVMRRQLYGT